jgi:arylsulfatase A-like enzyme
MRKRITRRWLALLFLATFASPATATTSSASPNILLIVLDDIGNERLAVYGEGSVTPQTPALDMLAQYGLRFCNFYGQPVCSPARACLLTGLQPQDHGIGWVVQPTEPDGLPLALTTIPEALPEPYTSALVGKWHLSTNATAYPLDPVLHGFDIFAGVPGNLSSYTAWQRDVVTVNGGFRSEPMTTYATTQQADDALDAIRLLPEPWFLLVSFSAAHDPFHTPPGYADPGTDLGRYLLMVEALDAELGRIFCGVDPCDTVVMVASDNGTPNAVSDYPGTGGTCPYPCGAKKWLNEPGINVPLIVAGLGVTPGTVTDSLAHLVDLGATVVDLAGGSSLGEGVSLAPIFADSSHEVRSHVFVERFIPNASADPTFSQYRRTARDSRHKLLRRPRPGGFAEWFFDLDTAPPGTDGADIPTLAFPAEYAALASLLDSLEAK